MNLDRDRIAQALPNYAIGEEVGRGAWGVVLRGEHVRLGRHVAIKELPQAFAADPAVQRRFASEARLLASFDHPHIVHIFDYVEEGGLCLLVMELLTGGTVWDRATTEGISAETACGVVLATCSALHYAHGKGILHRDIKPENLLFSSSGTLKVTDFGIAKVLGGAETFATRTGTVMGTPAYIAPEQAQAKELSPATDVYAVGTLLYELLSGQLPFVDDGNPLTLLYRHVHEQPRPLRDVVPAVPEPIAEATMKALATDPADRFSNAEDFGVALADAAGAAWNTGWASRLGLDVMASGPNAARISGEPGTGRDTTTPRVAPVEQATPAPDTLAARAHPEPSAAKPPTGGAGGSAHRQADEVTETTPDNVVAGQEMLPAHPQDEPAADGRAPAVPAVPSIADERPRRRRRRAVLLAAALVVLATVTIVVVTQLGSKGGPSPRTAAAPRPASPGRLIFTDNFSNPGSGWAPDAGQDGSGAGAYVAGSYQVTALKPNNPRNTFSVASPYTPKLTSIAVSVNATILTGAPADGAGVRCDQGGRNGLRYTFETNGDGTWAIFKLGGQGQPLLSQGRSAAIRTGTGPNTIAGQCTELSGGVTRLIMTVNGTVVGQATNSHGQGPIGWHGALVVYRSLASPGTKVGFAAFGTLDLRRAGAGH